MKSYLRYVYAILAVPVAILLRFALIPLTGHGTPFITLFPATVIVALLGGMGPAVLTGVLGVLGSDYFFIQPLHTFDLSIDFWSRTAIVILTSTFIGYVGAVLRDARAKAEQQALALRDSQKDLNRAQAVAHTGSWRLDVRRNELTWSDESYQIFGVPKGTSLTYESFLAFVHPDDRNFVDKLWKAALDGEKYDIEHRIIVDGKVKWVRERADLEFDKNGTLFGGFGTVTDITERKKAEEALRKAHDELEIRVRERTAELMEINESLRLERSRLDALLRLSQISEASTSEIAGFVLEQGIALTQSKIGFVGFLSEDESTYTLHSVSKDVVKGCNVEGNPVHWPVDNAGIWADSIRERRTLFVNDYSKPHPRKKGIPTGHVPIERFMVVPLIENKRIVTIAGVGNKDSNYDKSDERQVSLLLSGMWNCVQKSRSREELQKAYNELDERVKQRTAELMRSNKELEQFAYVASHDLQEPLRIIAGYTQLLQQRYKGKLDEDADQFIAFTVDSVVRMQNLINDLLSYSRIETRGGAFEPADCQAILNDVLHTLQIVVEENDAVITHGPLPTVQADRAQLFQLFQNLIGNAIKFRSDKPPRIHITAEPQNGRWLFSVKDNGIGIDPKYSERIFVIFQRLHSQDKYSGTGIGLAICKKIVERHGGRIWVESQAAKGATFYFIL
jgi:PAS domain S-box-containing protein